MELLNTRGENMFSLMDNDHSMESVILKIAIVIYFAQKNLGLGETELFIDQFSSCHLGQCFTISIKDIFSPMC